MSRTSPGAAQLAASVPYASASTGLRATKNGRATDPGPSADAPDASPAVAIQYRPGDSFGPVTVALGSLSVDGGSGTAAPHARPTASSIST